MKIDFEARSKVDSVRRPAAARSASAGSTSARPGLARAALFLAMLATGFVGHASAVTVYDPGLNTLPSAQGFTTSGVGAYTQSAGGGVYTLNTTAALAAGSAIAAPLQLDTQSGFTLDFDLRIVSETHADTQRAGFSVIFTGADPTHSLELGFWQTGVFAYGAGFVPGTLATFATGVATDYSLIVGDNQYRLVADGTTLLTGSLVDYTSRGSPYTLANGLFFGDDTSRGASVSEMGRVSLVSSVPEPTSVAMMLVGLAALGALGAMPRTRKLAPVPAGN